MTHRKLTSKDELTSLIKGKGIKTWETLINYTQNLPYGRNANRTDFKLIITEQKGSCSSKHAFLKKVADLNQIENIKLILGIYIMHQNNTPNIGTALLNHNIDFIPEAHCYLKIDGIRKDFTTPNSNFNSIEKDIIEELEIKPEQVSEYKVEYHKSFLKKWISNNQIPHNFQEVWSIREQCITNLSKNSSN